MNDYVPGFALRASFGRGTGAAALEEDQEFVSSCRTDRERVFPALGAPRLSHWPEQIPSGL